VDKAIAFDGSNLVVTDFRVLARIAFLPKYQPRLSGSRLTKSVGVHHLLSDLRRIASAIGKLRRLDFAHSAQRPHALSLKIHQYADDNRRHPDKFSLNPRRCSKPNLVDRPATLAS
jgi:hypothetical protein